MNLHLMCMRRVLPAVFWLVAASAGLSSCQHGGGGASAPHMLRGASVTIRRAGAMEVRSATVDVMTENGFRLASPYGDVMVFEKEGTRNDELMYGSYGSRPMRQRVTISLEMGEEVETVRLLAEGKVVREYGNMSGEETGWLLAGGRHRYGKHLKQIKARVERELAASVEF